MKIVIDVGCARYGGDYSIERLIEWYHPNVLYGFDPAQGQDEYPWAPHDPAGPTGPAIATSIKISKQAAWVYDGEVHFLTDGLSGRVEPLEKEWPLVPCFDLARFIIELGDFEIYLKLDCEGSEYLLLEHLLYKSVDEKLAGLVVEWHPFGILDWPERRRLIERRLRCPIEEWRW